MHRFVTLVAVVGLALASCGDDEPESVTTTTPTTTASTTTTTTTATTTTPTTRTAPTLRCATVGFTPNTEDAASDVTATGLSCPEAEAFVRVAGRQTSAGGPAEVDVEGYHCVRTGAEEEPLPRSFYECTDGDKKVTFVRS